MPSYVLLPELLINNEYYHAIAAPVCSIFAVRNNILKILSEREN